MSKKTFKKSEGTSLVSIIGDEVLKYYWYFKDTVTGFLLTGIGEKNIKGETNFLVVDSSMYNHYFSKPILNWLKLLFRISWSILI